MREFVQGFIIEQKRFLPLCQTKGKNQRFNATMNNLTKPTVFFSDNQCKLFSVTLSMSCLLILLSTAGLLVYCLSLFLDSFASVVWPLVAAVILSVLLSPVVEFIERALGLRKSLSILLLYLLVLMGCGLLLWVLGEKVLDQAREFTEASANWPERIERGLLQKISQENWSLVSSHYEHFKREWHGSLSALSKQAPRVAQNSTLLIKSAWDGLSSLFGQIACLVIVPVYLFYFLSSKRNYFSDFLGQVPFLRADIRDDLLYLASQFKQIIEAFFRGQLIIGMMMGVGYAIGFTFCGLKFGLALGLLFGLLNVVPFLGSLLGFFTVLAVSYLQPGGIGETGQYNVFVGCLTTFAIVQLIESYWLSPKVMGERTGLHPVAIIASVFFWGTVLEGLLGVIVGIPLTAFLIIAWRLIRQKYLVPSN
jgi:predicted PurR-regulated permease PerM